MARPSGKTADLKGSFIRTISGGGGPRINYTGVQTKAPVETEERSSATPEYKGWLSTTLRTPNRLFRAATFQSPIVGTLALTALASLAGWHAAPLVDRIVSPRFGGMPAPDEDTLKKRRRAWAIGLGTLAGLGFLGMHVSPNREGYGLLQYPSMDVEPPVSTSSGELQKTGSDPFSGLSIQDCTDLIKANNSLTPEMKINALSLLRSFDAPPTTTVNGGSLVGQAIDTGLSAAAGAAIGFITANALGLPNPSSTAILGAVQNTMGTGPALATSLIFGH